MNDDQELAKIRATIDDLDAQLIELLAQRMQHVRQAGIYKQAHALAALDETRWQKATVARLAQARELGLAEGLVQALYELIHRYTLQIEKDLGAK